MEREGEIGERRRDWREKERDGEIEEGGRDGKIGKRGRDKGREIGKKCREKR